MTADHHGESAKLIPPIVLLGPCGTAFLAVEGSVDAALAHLFADDHYGDAAAETPVAPGLPPFDGTDLVDAGQIRPPATLTTVDPPTSDAYDAFLDELLWQVRTDLPMHKGSWWHNLFHR